MNDPYVQAQYIYIRIFPFKNCNPLKMAAELFLSVFSLAKPSTVLTGNYFKSKFKPDLLFSRPYSTIHSTRGLQV